MRRIIFFAISFFVANVLYAQDTTRLSMLFVGDVMGHDSQIAAAYDAASNTYDYQSCFRFVEPIIKSVDLAFANLEVTLAGKPFKGYPQFSSPDELAVTLKNMGFDVLVTANNHSLDRRKKGVERTVRVLDSLAILHTGTFVDTVSRMNDYPLIFTKNGFKIALLNYTYGTNGIPTTKPNIVNRIDTAVMRLDLLKAKEHNPDIIISFLHWGNEYQPLPSSYQKNIAKFCFNNGSDLVIGAHPHVLQPMEWRKDNNQVVVYSLGNFVSGQRKRYTDGGGMVRIDLQKILKDDTIKTSIDTVGYLLEWVHRDAQKVYTILPSSMLKENNDSTGFKLDNISKAAFQVFVDDSRALFKKHNVNVGEFEFIPVNSTIRYRIELTGMQQNQLDSISNKKILFYGLEKSVNKDAEESYQVGNFDRLESAEKFSEEIKLVYPTLEVKVLKYINGIIVE